MQGYSCHFTKQNKNNPWSPISKIRRGESCRAKQRTPMVCEKCQKKLSKVIVPDKWKEGASNTTESGGRKINENKLLSKKHRWTPYGNTKCLICKQQVHQDAKYCHTCAYSKGVCAMCGKQVLDTKLYKQSNV
ncbi:cysteine-rich PDZ-binding protein-like [Durio zibethinus]|uniref:Cysteine-rich PDZ-binding protein n=1 Tax=Durio zibethinus TaxID=66656 RepID=A0A6P5WJD9_DURZI|nr:cysteine-rich PDZ-binding protein-like [Durio zibethinus]